MNQSLIEWILVTHPDRSVKAWILSDCFSDHSFVLFFIWEITILKLPPRVIKLRQHEGEIRDEFTNDLVSINWDRYQLIPNVHESWDFFIF